MQSRRMFDKKITKIERVARLWSSFAEFELRRKVLRYTKPQLGEWSKNRLAEMGPTFIKIGQFLSTRSDILGEEFTSPLRQLCENVSPVPYDLVSDKLDRIGIDVDVNPIASASIAQVHRGSIESDGDVAVKIKRPGIEAQIVEDFETLLFCVQLLKRVSTDHRISEFQILFREYFEILKYEIDFKTEVGNLLRFARCARNYSDVCVPTPIDTLCTDEVIVMNYLPSLRVDDLEGLRKNGIDAAKLAERLSELMFRSILEFGFVHIDPHPGNLGVDVESGRIVMYDFGMMLDLGQDIQQQLTKLFFAIADRDVKSIRAVSIEMGMVIVDPSDVPLFETFLSSMISYLDTADLEQFRAKYLDKQKDPANVPFMLSSKFVLLMRGLSILEGVCKRLDPEFNVQRAIERHFKNRFFDVRYLEARALSDIRSLWSVPLRVDETQTRLDLLERTVNESQRGREAAVTLQTAWGAVATLAAVWFALGPR